MVVRSEELSREIAATRQEVEERLLELRRRGEVAARSSARVALIAAAGGAALGAVIVTAVVAYRMTRPLSTRERIRRVLPGSLGDRWRRFELLIRKGVPSMRFYVNDRAVGEKPETTGERIAVAVTRTLGTAVAAAAMRAVMNRLGTRAESSATAVTSRGPRPA